MHIVDEPRHRIRIRLRPDAVSQIEDVPGTAAGLIEHPSGVLPQVLRRGEERRRVEVALHGLPRPQLSPHLTQRRAPVDADHIDPKVRDVVHERRALIDVVDERHAGIAERRHGAPHGAQRKPLEFPWRQQSGP